MASLALPKVECVESTEIHGRFVAEPLEKGFGVTLGNSLRRVLLSSLPGAAITWVMIEGMQHEFSTIPYVKEDTIDFLLNVKAIRLRHLAQRPGKLRLEVEGEGQVCAGDIKSSADFEIVNPELHLATLDSHKANLRVEFNVEVGRGYVPASSGDSLPIGAIPIDAIFTPVRKVNYSVEPSSIREGSNQEKLILEVWTDGTLSPIEAVSQSAAILVEQFSCFRELAKAVTLEGAEVSWQRLLPPEQYLMPLDQLNLSTHTYNSLRRGGVTTLGQILERGIDGLRALAGFGAKSTEEVETALKRLDLPFIPESKEKKEKKKGTSLASNKAESNSDS
ncbi:MAG: DNA-directed RNA polymerase subunit alpha [Chloroflexi bacterium]|nr:DNA-directed RNA polymerase subunit alpha [Chloroflexota bacterium]